MTTLTNKPSANTMTDAGGASLPMRTLSVEVFAVGALALAAFALRLLHNDSMPLDGGESAIALAAWQAAHAMGSGVVGAPLLYHAERLAFWILGDGDRVARLMPAVFGALAVLMTLGLRRTLGRAGALAAAGLLALSPVWTFWGRHLSEIPVGAFAFLAVLAALEALGEGIVLPPSAGVVELPTQEATAKPRRKSESATSASASEGLVSAANAAARTWYLPIALGLAFAAGGPVRSGLVAALVFVVAQFATGRGRRIEAAWAAVAGSDGGRGFLTTFAVTALLAASGLLTALDGVGAAVLHIVGWFGRLGSPGSPWSAYLLPLLVYGPLTLFMGLAGAVFCVWRRLPWGLYFVVWAVISLLTGLLAGRPEALADLFLPLTLLAALALGRLAELVGRHFTWSEDGVMIAMLTVVLLYALNAAVAIAEVPEGSPDLQPLLTKLVASGTIIVALSIILVVLWRNTLVVRVIGTVATIGLAALAWANGSALNYRPTDELREPMRPDYVAPGARMLVDDLQMASWFNTRDPNAMAVVADPTLRPILGWYLRQMPVTWKEAKGTLNARAVITPEEVPAVAGAPAAFGPGAYRGRAYPVEGHWLPQFGTLRGFFQWYLQRRVGGNMDDALIPPRVTHAVLYLQVDASAPSAEAP